MAGPDWATGSIVLDPGGALYAAIGRQPAGVGGRAGTVGHAALSNLVLSERQLLIWDALTGRKPVTPKAASG